MVRLLRITGLRTLYVTENKIIPGGRGGSHMKQTGMLVVSLKGVNFLFWSRLGVPGKAPTF